MASEPRRRGDAAEQATQHWLTQQGVTLLQTNFHTRYGEIDLIGLHREQLVFFEVRFRSSSRFGGAAASVTAAKQQKIVSAAQLFLQQHPQYANTSCRFDVIAASGQPDNWQFDWLQQAFYGEH